MLQFSYGKLMIGLWSLVLLWLSIQQRGYLQCAVTAMMVFDVFSTQDGDAIMLLPLLLLSERCMLSTVSLKHSAMPYVTSALFAHCLKNARSGSWWSFALFAQGAGIVIPYALGVHPSQGFGATAYILTGTVAFLCLRRSQSVSEREALLLASLCGFINYDTIINRTVDPSLRGVISITGFPHIAGRSVLAAAQVVLLLVSLASMMTSNKKQKAASHQQAAAKSKKGTGASAALSKESTTASTVSTSTFLLCLYSGVMVGYGMCFYTFREEPFTWLLAYLISSPMRLRALILWLIGIPISVVCIHIFCDKMKVILRRKLFHLVGVIAFLPMALFDGEFLAFSVCVAFSLGVILECARLHGVRGTGNLSRWMATHLDGREKNPATGSIVNSSGGGGGAIRTHLYLVLGFALSIIIYMRQQMTVGLPLAPPLLMAVFILPGIVGLGVMDAVAAVVGTFWHTRTTRVILEAVRGGGSNKPPSAAVVKAIQEETAKGTLGYFMCREGSFLAKVFPSRLNPSLQRKTVMGTVTAIAVGELLWVGVLQAGLLGVRDYRVALPSIVAIALGGFAEATLDGIDNLELPLVMSGILQTAIALVSFAVSPSR